MTTIQQYTPHLESYGDDVEEKFDSKDEEQGNESKIVVQEVAEGPDDEPVEQYTEAEFKRVKRKVDFVLLACVSFPLDDPSTLLTDSCPASALMWLCYGIQQTDKTSIGTQALYGLRADTGLVGQQYAMLTTLFYISYMISEFPSTYMLQRLNMGKGLSLYMIAWAAMVLAVASAKNFSQLAAFRFLQGLFESTISPGFLFIIASWYKVEEHASRSLFFQSANAGFGIVADLVMVGIAKAAAKNPEGIHAWRGIGYFLGGITLLAALSCLVLLGTPSEVWWLSKRDKLIANARIMENHAGTDRTGRRNFNWAQVREAFKDPQCYFSIANTFLSIPNGGLTTFGSLINASFGFTNEQVILYGIPRNIVSVSLFLLIGIMTRRKKGLRFYFMIAGTIPPFVGLLTIALLPTDISYRWIKWGCYLMAVTFIIPTFMGWQMIPSNVAGKTKRTVISSATFIAYCVGNIIGSQVFRANDAPQYLTGTAVVAAAIGVQCLVCIAWRFYYVYENKRRDKITDAMGLSFEDYEAKAKEMGAQDKTDRENVFFRYSL